MDPDERQSNLTGLSGTDREITSRFLFRRLEDGLFLFDRMSGETVLLPPDMQSCSHFLETRLGSDMMAVAHWQSIFLNSGLVED
ncbi:MAG: hypothetical protein CVU34_00735 [Betaproteobacteria bacterium HGW-Betaproteobacteria-7]|jgi:hypothetical protein|nr:MAG: hypothetical protein CVU34_00735 [Betaproteobacteria bacterium HGW-Betaproteobacteria-7]